jgi:phosphopantetheinyl transferase
MASTIRTRYAPLADLPVHETRAADRWLSLAERREWDRLRSAERRATWLGGRILAKRLIMERLAEPAEIHIESRSSDGEHGERPTALVAGRALDWALSIAHTRRGVLVALGCEPGVRLGVDLVCRDADRRPLIWTFTEAERRWLAGGGPQDRLPEQLWAMKEALYKACQQGEGFAPGRIEVVPEISYPALGAEHRVRSLQCWRVDGQVAALAVVGETGFRASHAA